EVPDPHLSHPYGHLQANRFSGFPPSRLSDLLQFGIELLMLRAGILVLLLAGLGSTQQLIDAIAARVENDIILLSDVRALARYQQLVDGRSENDAQILDRLIDQWIVRNEADAAQFPHPQEVEVHRALEQLRGSYGSPEEYETRKKQAGVSDQDI